MATITIRMDDNVKNDFAKACNDMGLDMSSAINVFAKMVIKEQCIPFIIKADPFYSESNIKHLEKVVEDIESGKAKLEEHDLIEVE